MQRINSGMTSAVALAFAGMLAIGPAMAEKPSWAGGSKGGDRNEHSDQRKNQKEVERTHAQGNSPSASGRSESAARLHFEDRHRTAVNDYYDQQFRSGRCPPGLAKKDNGCMPPGQAKKWQVGQPLQQNVTYYTVPQSLRVQLGQPPVGYRYVRVGNDILLMSNSNRTILDSILNLGRL